MKLFNCLQSMRVVKPHWLVLFCVLALSSNAYAQTQSSAKSDIAIELSSDSSSSVSSLSSADKDVEDDSDDNWRDDRWGHKNRHRNERVSIGHGVTLRAGERADSVVAILGNVSSDGEVIKDVVAVVGNARITGSVGRDVVVTMGNVFINSSVGHDVVVTMGNVELGPQAVINGRLVTTGGNVNRDVAAVVRGGVVNSSFGSKVGFDWLHPWIDHCLMYGRPLALAPGLGWAWGLALISLLFYVLTAAMAPRAVDRCVTTLTTSPGYSLLAAVLAMLATPILFVLLVITVVGILAIPFLGIALLCVGFFGKLVMLAWLGRRFMPTFSGNASTHAALTTLLGGVIVTVLYLVPVLGFVVYKLLGFIGLGVVVYALILMARDKNQQNNQRSNIPPEATVVDGGATTSANVSNAAASDAASSATADSATQTVITDVVSLPRATFWIRMGALLLDIALVAFILNVVFHLDDILLLAVAVYGALMWKFRGTTIGGILFNLRVVRLDGRALDWPTVIVRALSCFLSLIALGLGFIWIAFDPERQAWHDKIAGTVVVRTPKGVSLV